ncbi:MAG: exopolyphosphatase [Gammaproteobacteria bacterium]|nr:exopolyphosphatase [Rhodocyclaceae bacterium]MBU3909832.1 exopolyphosphatase [Gammaproteobacteria bacterium]MBU3988066.1 exopolyphosphatase [Gammaproteobacteria bacterium]MBU4003589.1 exopolyphosphatase [Gammaproteobacteria bacterium]MBU4020052.1 exopolyphosphatase [Gammaproteobacteria bacterium]
MVHEHVAAVDMGSNSFRLQVGRIVGNQIYPLDGLKETVRLAAGLTPEKHLDEAAQQRALAALARFGERLRDFAPEAVRAVATNTLRVARNAPQFLMEAEAALGFPIEVIAGREEARLIYLGVAHTLPNPHVRNLIVDIGGGSTEFIIGQNIKPLQLESLYMGCVSFSLRYFPEGRVDKRSMNEAELAASRELQTIAKAYRDTSWDAAVGSSGTAKAIRDILELNGYADGNITRAGLERLRNCLVKAGGAERAGLQGMRPERVPVIIGGVAIMSAVFKEFDLEEMNFSEGALRLGVLYDLLGRYHHEDLREATVSRFMQRYEVDPQQAARVSLMALKLYRQLRSTDLVENSVNAQFLSWAARLHEIGISVAHAGYHKHSAYVLANADMPGFSKRDQALLARLVLAHRGKLERVQTLTQTMPEYLPIFCLRIAALLHRARDDEPVPEIDVSITAKGYELNIDRTWLASAPLTAAVLASETQQWASVAIEFRVRAKLQRVATEA